jgi:hypothetical protein
MVYLIHFHECIGDPDNPRGQAQHYIGFAENDLDGRLAEHRSGRGASITAFLAEKDIGFDLVRVWVGDRALERRLKQRKEAPALCPICNPEGWQRLANYAANWQPGIPVTFEPLEERAAVDVAECPF